MRIRVSVRPFCLIWANNTYLFIFFSGEAKRQMKILQYIYDNNVRMCATIDLAKLCRHLRRFWTRIEKKRFNVGHCCVSMLIFDSNIVLLRQHIHILIPCYWSLVPAASPRFQRKRKKPKEAYKILFEWINKVSKK